MGIVVVFFSSSSLYAYDFTNNVGNSPYYNSQSHDNSNYRGGNDRNYNAEDNSRQQIYGDDNSYRSSNGMIYNR